MQRNRPRPGNRRIDRRPTNDYRIFPNGEKERVPAWARETFHDRDRRNLGRTRFSQIESCARDTENLKDDEAGITILNIELGFIAV